MNTAPPGCARLSIDALQQLLDQLSVSMFTEKQTLEYTSAFNASVVFDDQHVIGRTDRDLMPPDVADEVLALKHSVLRTGTAVEANLRFGERHLNLFVAPIRDEAGGLAGLVSSWRPVVEQSPMMRQLQHAQRLEVANRLAVGVAHDFNNLLMGIAGCADLASEHLPPDNPATPFLVRAKNAALRGSQLADGLTAFTRSQQDSVELLDLNLLIDQAVSLVRPALGKAVRFDVKLDAEDPWIRAAPGQVEQVLMTLFVNARDAMPNGGRLSVRTQRGSDRTVRVLVDDSGGHLDSDTAAGLEAPASLSDSNGRATRQGHSMAKAIVESLGGHVEVQRAPGQGTSVIIELPSTPPPPVPIEPGYAREGGQEGSLVLLVEDDPLARMCIGHYLERNGYDVVEACNARDGVRLANRFRDRLGLLVTDLVLPTMSGTALAERVQLLVPRVRTILMSGYECSPTPINGDGGGRTEILFKPFAEGELVARVEAALSRRGAAQPILQ